MGLSILIAGCDTKHKSPLDTLVIGIESSIKNLDPRSATDANTSHLAKLMVQSLVDLDDNLEVAADLAESFVAKDGKLFTFKIPPNIFFHDGVKLTSRDVLESYKQAAGPTSKMRSSLSDVEAFLAPDEYTFVVRLKAARPSFLTTEAVAVRIFPVHLAQDKNYAQNPVGSGPFKFLKRQDRDIYFERFDLYKKQGSVPKDLSSFKTIIVRSIEDPTTRFLSLVGGDIDIVVNALAPRKVLEAEKLKTLQVLRSPGNSYQYLALNERFPKFKDPRVREALDLALNKDEIIKYKLHGFADPSVSLLSKQNYFFNSKLKLTPYDVNRARELLKLAGADNLEIELRCSSDKDVVSLLQVIKSQWEQAGVKVTLRPYEFATFFSDVLKGNAEAYVLRWTAVVEPDLFYGIFHSSQTPPGKNRIGYSNAQFDNLVERGRTEWDKAKRKKIYDEAQEILARDRPYISLWHPNNIAVAQKYLLNLRLNPTGNWLPLLEAKKE